MNREELKKAFLDAYEFWAAGQRDPQVSFAEREFRWAGYCAARDQYFARPQGFFAQAISLN